MGYPEEGQQRMDRDVNAATLRRTNCRRGFSCLSPRTRLLCPVKDFVEERVLFVERIDMASCDYCQSFGDAFTCNCPVRKELYKQYRY
jgi:hypothetical protein